MINILIVGLYRGKGALGGVTNYNNLLLTHLDKNKFSVNYFSLGKSPNCYAGEDCPTTFRYHIGHLKKIIEFVGMIKRKQIQI